jgi:hypothetical protein
VLESGVIGTATMRVSRLQQLEAASDSHPQGTNVKTTTKSHRRRTNNKRNPAVVQPPERRVIKPVALQDKQQAITVEKGADS